MDRRSFLLKSAGLLLGGIFATRTPVAAELFLPPAPTDPRIALIIDDIGFNLHRARMFLAAGVPMTFSILPHVCRSIDSALALHESGQQVMLHQPMEPFSTKVDPGPGAIFVNDCPQRVHDVVAENIDALPHLVGVNNHMGSRYTQLPDKMDQALAVIRDRKLFFIDSLTTGRSTAFARARQMGLAVNRRDIFLDTRPDVESVVRQMHRLEKIALKHGSAIGIGHPRRQTLEGILRYLDAAQPSKVRFVHLSQLLSAPPART